MNVAGEGRAAVAVAVLTERVEVELGAAQDLPFGGVEEGFAFGGVGLAAGSVDTLLKLIAVTGETRAGVVAGLAAALPDYCIEAMREALPAFGKKIRGYDMHDAVLTGVETRTSAPLRITRGEDCQSLNVSGLFPAGEGAGYAGGILSAGVDGIKVAEAVAQAILAERR
jgi:hypothetical protein